MSERSVIAKVKWSASPLWSLVASREEFGGDDLPLLSMSAQFGVRRRVVGEGRAAADDISGYRVVRKGDLVVNKLSARDGAFGISPLDGLVSPAYWVLRPIRPDLDPRWLDYVMRSAPYMAELRRISKQMPPAQFDLPWDQFRLVRIPVPRLDEQEIIANFLDTETARIDVLVATRRSLLNRLEERIDAMISTAIGDSALAGGSGPAKELRRLLAKRRRPGGVGHVVTAFRDGQVTARELRRAEGYTEAWTDNATFQQVWRGDVVVHGLDGFAGAVGTSEADGICSPVYHVMEPLDGGDSEFYGRLLRRLAVTGYLGLFAVSTRERAVDFRNWDLFGRIPVPEAPISLQREIGARIEALRPLRAAIKRSEALTLEHRHALITKVVTGDFEIPGVA